MNSNNSNSNAQQPTSRLQSKVLLARTILYGAFLLFALLTFILGAALIGKTSMDCKPLSRIFSLLYRLTLLLPQSDCEILPNATSHVTLLIPPSATTKRVPNFSSPASWP